MSKVQLPTYVALDIGYMVIYLIADLGPSFSGTIAPDSERGQRVPAPLN